MKVGLITQRYPAKPVFIVPGLADELAGVDALDVNLSPVPQTLDLWPDSFTETPGDRAEMARRARESNAVQMSKRAGVGQREDILRSAAGRESTH